MTLRDVRDFFVGLAMLYMVGWSVVLIWFMVATDNHIWWIWVMSVVCLTGIPWMVVDDILSERKVKG